MHEVINYCFPGDAKTQRDVAQIIEKALDEIKKNANIFKSMPSGLAGYAQAWMSNIQSILQRTQAMLPQYISYDRFADITDTYSMFEEPIHPGQVHDFATTVNTDPAAKQRFSHPCRVFVCAEAELLRNQGRSDWLAVTIAKSVNFAAGLALLKKHISPAVPVYHAATSKVSSLIASLVAPTINHVMLPRNAAQNTPPLYTSDRANQQLVLTPAGKKRRKIFALKVARLINLTTAQLFLAAPQLHEPLMPFNTYFSSEQCSKENIFSFLIENIMPLKNDVSTYMAGLIRGNILEQFMRFYMSTAPRPLARLRHNLFASIMRVLRIRIIHIADDEYQLHIRNDHQNTEACTATDANAVSKLLRMQTETLTHNGAMTVQCTAMQHSR